MAFLAQMTWLGPNPSHALQPRLWFFINENSSTFMLHDCIRLVLVIAWRAEQCASFFFCKTSQQARAAASTTWLVALISHLEADARLIPSKIIIDPFLRLRSTIDNLHLQIYKRQSGLVRGSVKDLPLMHIWQIAPS
jgi:hypothetical protein